MITDARNFPILDLFGSGSKKVYEIPRYQREYTWNREKWETFFDDIDGNEKGYFFGSIICIKRANNSDVLDVVDGQQRLTTLSLLFAALYQFLKNHDKELDEEQREERIYLRRKLVLRGDNDQFRIVPQIQNNNQGDYRAILSHVGATKNRFDKPRNAGNRRIFRAFKYFKTRIKKMVTGKEGNKLDLILSFLEKVNHSCLVKIEVENHADACVLFESLNDRGMPLTPIDLIKNKILANLEKVEDGNIDTHFESWRNLLKDIGDDYVVQERFFRHYYNAFKDTLNAPFRSGGSKKKDPLGLVATRTNLTEIYENLMGKNGEYAKKRLNDIREKGELYSLMSRPTENEEDKWKPLEKPLLDLDRIQGAPSHLLMLYLLAKRRDLNISMDNLRQIIKLLVSFFVRRNLTDRPPTRELTSLFMNTIDKISSSSGDEVVKTIRKELKAVSASDALFKDELKDAIYEKNKGVTRFILCALEEDSMNDETWRDLWRRKGNRYVWTIEHILPQGPNIPDEWVDMIAGGDKDEAKAIQESHVHTIGNLTISGFNARLGNKSFAYKRDRKGKKGYEGYKNDLKLNKRLRKEETWNKAKIEERTSVLTDRVLARFKMD